MQMQLGCKCTVKRKPVWMVQRGSDFCVSLLSPLVHRPVGILSSTSVLFNLSLRHLFVTQLCFALYASGQPPHIIVCVLWCNVHAAAFRCLEFSGTFRSLYNSIVEIVIVLMPCSTRCHCWPRHYCRQRHHSITIITWSEWIASSNLDIRVRACNWKFPSGHSVGSTQIHECRWNVLK